jgi:hypothetical protein
MKLSFLFLIYNIIEQEALWYDFFKDIDKKLYTIYIYVKNKNNLKLNNFFKEFVIEKDYDTEWGTYSIVHVYNRLLELSYQDKLNYKFIFVSGTHIPLHHFNFIYNTLMTNNNSYISYFDLNIKSEMISSYDRKLKPLTHYLRHFSKLKNISNKWYYGSNWFILNRTHTNFILNKEELITNTFNKSMYPDEYAYLNILKEYNQTNIINKATTYHNFKIESKNKVYRKYPHTFDQKELTDDLIKKFKTNYLFLRKIPSEININRKIIFETTNTFIFNKDIDIIF